MKLIHGYSKLCVLGLLIFLSTMANAQKVHHKDVKHAIEQGKVVEISIISEDKFTPERNQEFDLKIVLGNGVSVMASDFHFVWDDVELTVSNSPMKIKGEFLADGKGLLKPGDPSEYYPAVPIVITASLAGKTTDKTLTPNFCFENYTLARRGNKGSTGSSGTSGYNGRPGDNGGKGGKGGDSPGFEIQIEEEVIGEKPFIILILNNKKYPFDPSCSSIAVICEGGAGGDGGRGGSGGDGAKDSKYKYTGSGGRGGSGGAGGDGGNGGNITVSGSAYDKYKEKISFVSQGGAGGRGGSGASGGNGTSSGSYGSSGSNGRSGNQGQVIIKP